MRTRRSGDRAIRRRLLIIGLFSLRIWSVYAQQSYDFSGYISNMGQFTHAGSSTNYSDLIIHNRLKLKVYANDKLTFSLEGRNQFLWGQSFALSPDYATDFEKDRGWADLNFNWYSNGNSLLNTQIDRAYAQYTIQNVEFTLGRQRVNWGRSLVWNPNDIFNAFSYYDFDYPERPGSDAIRVSYYRKTASQIDFVLKADSANSITSAALYKFNKWSYDIQLMAGYVNSEDYVVGAGWEGFISKLGFRGELSYYFPNQNQSALLASVSLDYLVQNDVTMQFEFLYNDPDYILDISDPTVIFQAPPTSKSLSFSEYNFYAGAMWQVSPIVSTNLGTMYYTDLNGYFLMPGIDISLVQNLDGSLIYQYFNFEVDQQRASSQLLFLRLKWSF